ncbi:MAG TPA: type II secretion system protein N [Nitrospiraceae bacterium]|nr:type II secretion system protein N [Nitrospiraceae bacterium]
MARRHIISDELRKRLLLTAFVSAGTFLLAHAVNGVVAYSLVQPVDQLHTMEPAIQSGPDSHASQRTRQALVQEILSRGLFPLPPAPKETGSPGSVTAPSAPPLDVAAKVSLIGIVRGVQGSERAIIEDLTSKKQRLYRVSQHIQDVGELAAIEKDRVLFREGEQEEWLELAIVKQRAAMVPFPRESQPIPEVIPLRSLLQNPPSRRTVDRAQLIDLTAKPEAYLTEARFLPHFSGSGQSDGFRVDGIRQVGVLEKAGFQNGDVLAGINGVEIRDPGRLWEMFKQLQQERTVQFNVVRQSQPMTLVVDIRG